MIDYRAIREYRSEQQIQFDNKAMARFMERFQPNFNSVFSTKSDPMPPRFETVGVCMRSEDELPNKFCTVKCIGSADIMLRPTTVEIDDPDEHKVLNYFDRDVDI